MYAFEFQEIIHDDEHISELLCDPKSAEEVGGNKHVVTLCAGVQAGLTNGQCVCQDYIKITCKSSDTAERISCYVREN
jgi:hypothetical protein